VSRMENNVKNYLYYLIFVKSVFHKFSIYITLKLCSHKIVYFPTSSKECVCITKRNPYAQRLHLVNNMHNTSTSIYFCFSVVDLQLILVLITV